MIICENILLQNGGEILEYHSNDSIFEQGTSAKHYLQIISGTVKMNTSNMDGKEFLYGLPYQGHCIAESYMFTEKKYPFNATAISNCEIIRLEKGKFHHLMEKTPTLLIDIFAYTAERIHYKNLTLSTLGITSCIERLTVLFDYIKEFYMLKDHKPFIIPYTRLQIASLTGICIETVIRTVKKMKNSIY
jgi:CRP-like cAMP-binding protein